ncbi:hypothetical protein ASG91_08195 [Phycicoccus sp. Soil802]|nr:hypothetical protein ASG91_08195 [Phycicoccus sp. Soil802]
MPVPQQHGMASPCVSCFLVEIAGIDHEQLTLRLCLVGLGLPTALAGEVQSDQRALGPIE